MLEWLKAGDPPNYVQILFAVLLLIEYVLGKTTLIKANSTLALVLTPVAWVLRKIVEATRKPPGGAGGAAVVALALLVAGCGAPATKARKVVSAADTFNEIVADGGRLGLVDCGAKAEAKAKAGDLAGAQIDLDKCRTKLVHLDMGLRLAHDASAAALVAIDIGEAAKAKDYTAALAPLKEAVRALLQLAVDAGVKIPPDALAAMKGLL